MVEEVIKYNVEIDTAQLSEQLMRARQQIDNAISSTGGTAGGVGGASTLAAEAANNQGMMDQLIDRTENYGFKMLDQIKADNFMLRDMSSMPSDFASRSTLENMMGGTLGYGYSPATSPYSMREYMKMSARNTNIRIPIFGTEAHGNQAMANFFQDVSIASIGGRLSDYDSLGLASEVRNLDLSGEFARQGFDRAEIANVVKSMAGQGDFISAQEVGDYAEKITATLQSLRSVMHSFRVTGEEAVQMQGTLRSLGIASEDVGDVAINMHARGSIAGLSARDMLVAAQTGGQVAASMGVSPLNAMDSYGTLLTDIRRGTATGTLDKWRVNSMGGEAGTMQALATESAKFWGTGPGLMALGGGEGITGVDDLINRQWAGNQMTALSPSMGILAANGQAAEIYSELTGDQPNVFQAAQMAANLFGIPVNASITASQLTKNADLGRAFQDRLNVAGAEVAKRQSELPAMGLAAIPDKTWDFISKQARVIGGSLSFSGRGITEMWGGYSSSPLNVGGDNVLSEAEYDAVMADPNRLETAGRYMQARAAHSFFKNITDADYTDDDILKEDLLGQATEYMDFLGVGYGSYGPLFRRKQDQNVRYKDVRAAMDAADRFNRPEDDTALAVVSTMQLTGHSVGTAEDRAAFDAAVGRAGLREKLRKAIPLASEEQLTSYAGSMREKLFALGVSTAETTTGGNVVNILRDSVQIEGIISDFAATANRIHAEASYIEGIKNMSDEDYASYISSGAAAGEVAVELLAVLRSRPGAKGIPVHITSDETKSNDPE